MRLLIVFGPLLFAGGIAVGLGLARWLLTSQFCPHCQSHLKWRQQIGAEASDPETESWFDRH
jgi:hypothetical protein